MVARIIYEPGERRGRLTYIEDVEPAGDSGERIYMGTRICIGSQYTVNTDALDERGTPWDFHEMIVGEEDCGWTVAVLARPELAQYLHLGQEGRYMTFEESIAGWGSHAHSLPFCLGPWICHSSRY